MTTTNLYSERFVQFAKNECKGSSSLYEFLSLKISADKEILDLCTHAQNGQPIPNLLLGSVHYLLMTGKDHPLMEYYPSLVEIPKNQNESFFYFKAFCMQYRNDIINLLETKIVQTNEVRRCAYLYPSFSSIYEKVNKPLSFIEIGTSAGLQLLWDQYKYSYNSSEIYGKLDSNVHINAEIKSNKSIYLPENSPPVLERDGIDLHVNDVNNKEDYLWLKALIWPEHVERRELFEQAANCMKNHHVKLIEGDGVKLLSKISSKITSESVLCIFHTHVANQMPEELKHRLLETIEDISLYRNVFHLYNNIWDRKLHLDYYIDGIKYEKVIGETEGHGKWFEWNLSL